MPILDVRVVGFVPDHFRHGLARRIADAAGEVFASRPHGTWVTLHFIEADAYSENGGGPPSGAQPVIASVLHAGPPQGVSFAEEVAGLTRALAEACGRPEANIHLIYEPAGEGRVAFGGKVR
jgi:phenylpyruvate tautomerase PptA (4-oxalocrotonate tautomerase family)